MHIATLLVTLNILIFIFAVATWIEVFPHRRLRSTRWLLLLNYCFCVISFCTLLVYVSSDFELKKEFSILRFLGLGVVGPTWLMLLSTVFQKWTWLQKKWVIGVLFLPGAITLTVTLIPQLNHLLVQAYEPIQVMSLHVLKLNVGPWFPVHYFWTLTSVVASLVLCGGVFLKNKGIVRQQVLALVSGTILSVAIDIYSVSTNSDLRWLMVASGTYLMSQIGVYYAIIRQNLLSIKSLAIKQVFQNLPDPVIVLDNQNLIRAGNNAAKKYFQFSDINIGQPVSQLLPSFQLSNKEFEIADSSNQVNFFEIETEALQQPSSKDHGQILFFRRITVRKAIESRLNENMEFKARLLALVAHDLSGHMEGQSNLIRSLQKSEIIQDINHISLLSDSTSTSQTLLNNIMSWIKTQGNKIEPQKKDFEWNALLQDCIEQQEVQIQLKNIDIVFSSNQRPIIAFGDSEMMMTVIRNILNNAIKSTHHHKKIFITIEKQDQNAWICIRDEGIGMTQDHIDHVLNSNLNLSSSPQFVKSGFGIGLSITKHFLDLHQGKLHLKSEPDQGTQVEILMPLNLNSTF